MARAAAFRGTPLSLVVTSGHGTDGWSVLATSVERYRAGLIHAVLRRAMAHLVAVEHQWRFTSVFEERPRCTR